MGHPRLLSAPQATRKCHEWKIPARQLHAALPTRVEHPRGRRLHHHPQHAQGADRQGCPGVLSSVGDSGQLGSDGLGRPASPVSGITLVGGGNRGCGLGWQRQPPEGERLSELTVQG